MKSIKNVGIFLFLLIVIIASGAASAQTVSGDTTVAAPAQVVSGDAVAVGTTQAPAGVAKVAASTQAAETTLSQAEVTDLFVGKTIHVDCGQYGTCVIKIDKDGTFEFNGGTLFDWGKWSFKEVNFKEVKWCRYYPKSRKETCVTFEKKPDGNIDMVSGQSRNKVLKVISK